MQPLLLILASVMTAMRPQPESFLFFLIESALICCNFQFSVLIFSHLTLNLVSFFHSAAAYFYLCRGIYFYVIIFLPSSPEHSLRESPLHLAVRWGLYRLAELLLCQPGGLMAVSLPNEEGVTPLQLAQTAGNTELLELLTQ